MKALIASLKYSPGHLSHILAWHKALKELNYDARILLHDNYREIVTFKQKEISFGTTINDVFDAVIFQNPSLTNMKFLGEAKKGNRNIKSLYVYHEPWDSLSNLLKRRPEFKNLIVSIIAHKFSSKLLENLDCVVLPSKHAEKIYEKYDKKFNPCFCHIPLLFDDEATEADLKDFDRTFFSYIGHVTTGHLFQEFLQFVKRSCESKNNIRFCIATRSDLTTVIHANSWIQSAINEGSLQIFHGRSLSNQEINNHYRKSFCIWNLYQGSTQSGVLPKAFMFGTPVIASPIGSFPEYVQSGKNGEIINSSVDFYEINSRLEKIKSSFKNYSTNARNTFLETFYYKANLTKLRAILFQNMK